MAGLNRKVLNSRRITKLVAPSNPVFSRSFITSFGVAFYKMRSGMLACPAFRPFSFAPALVPYAVTLSRPPFPTFPEEKIQLFLLG